MSDLLGSQRRRAEARQRRRAANGGRADGEEGQGSDGGGLDLKATAKSVAASAATRATLEAARAVVERATRHRSEEESKSPSEGSPEEPVDVKATAKRAATAAAVGAGLGMARALTSRPDDDGSDGEATEPFEEEEEEAPPSAQAEPDVSPDPEPRTYERPPARPDDVPGAELAQVKRVVAAAREQLEALQGRPVESVSGVERTHAGWTVSLEVVELARIPETTDVLATYELVLDGEANLVRYSRGRRYNRSQADDGPEA